MFNRSVKKLSKKYVDFKASRLQKKIEQTYEALLAHLENAEAQKRSKKINELIESLTTYNDDHKNPYTMTKKNF